MIEHICDKCGEKFDNHSLKANHIRWKHKNKESFNDDMSKLKKDFYDKKLGQFIDFNVKCENCGVDFIVNEREFKFPSKKKYFCSKSCSNSKCHNKPHSEETKNKLSKIAKELWKDNEFAKKCLSNKSFSSIGEREIRSFLKEKYGNKNVSSHRIVGIDNIKKAVDITIKNKNIILEYDGEWHFDKSIYERFGISKKYFEVIEKDNMVKKYCEINNIRLLRVSDKYYKHNRNSTKMEIIKFIESDLNYLELYY